MEANAQSGAPLKTHHNSLVTPKLCVYVIYVKGMSSTKKTEVMPQNVKAIKAILRCEMYLFQSIFQNSEKKYIQKRSTIIEMFIVCLNSPNTNQPPQKKLNEPNPTQPKPPLSPILNGAKWPIQGGATSNFGVIKGHSRHSIPPLGSILKKNEGESLLPNIFCLKIVLFPISWSLCFGEVFFSNWLGKDKVSLIVGNPKSKVVVGDFQLTREWKKSFWITSFKVGAQKTQLINRAI